MLLYELRRKERAPSNVEEVDDFLLNAGWRHFGGGLYAEVYAKADKDYVIKVFERDSAYLAFLKLAREHPNPHFPKVKGKVWLADHSARFNAVRLERLYPWKRVKVRGKNFPLPELFNMYVYMKKFPENAKMIYEESNLEFMETYFEDKPKLKEALDLIITLPFKLDLHDDNIMIRADGTPVIIDPVYY